MYGYWAYHLNYTEYQKQETEINNQLNAFFNKEKDVIESAFIVQLDTDYFKVDDSSVHEYYLVLIGHTGFDWKELRDLLYNLYDEYKKNHECIKNLFKDDDSDSKESDDEYMKKVHEYQNFYAKYDVYDCFDYVFSPEDDFESILRKEENPHGKIIKTFL